MKHDGDTRNGPTRRAKADTRKESPDKSPTDSGVVAVQHLLSLDFQAFTQELLASGTHLRAIRQKKVPAYWDMSNAAFFALKAKIESGEIEDPDFPRGFTYAVGTSGVYYLEAELMFWLLKKRFGNEAQTK